MLYKTKYVIINFALIVSCTVITSAQELVTSYEYAVKIICGTQNKGNYLVHAKGFYSTSINIHNPNNETVQFFKKLALTHPSGGQEPGRILRIGIDKLGYDSALATDCTDIRRRLFPQGFPGGYIEGFIIIQSPKSLDVSAVYTSEKPGWFFFSSNVSSIDVEQIRERIVEGKGRVELPDYIPVPDSSGSFCSIVGDSLYVTVKNIGLGDATVNSKIQVDFASGLSVQTYQVLPLMSGETKEFAFLVPKACYQGPAFPPTCEFKIEVNAGGAVIESDYGNNFAADVCLKQ